MLRMHQTSFLFALLPAPTAIPCSNTSHYIFQVQYVASSTCCHTIMDHWKTYLVPGIPVVYPPSTLWTTSEEQSTRCLYLGNKRHQRIICIPARTCVYVQAIKVYQDTWYQVPGINYHQLRLVVQTNEKFHRLYFVPEIIELPEFGHAILSCRSRYIKTVDLVPLLLQY